ncbi:MAG: hypothetical protein QOE84_3349 [Actinomycetota bacterium]|nr:hypothetical protein [Actinomycetota bacterium]
MLLGYVAITLVLLVSLLLLIAAQSLHGVLRPLRRGYRGERSRSSEDQRGSFSG